MAQNILAENIHDDIDNLISDTEFRLKDDPDNHDARYERGLLKDYDELLDYYLDHCQRIRDDKHLIIDPIRLFRNQIECDIIKYWNFDHQWHHDVRPTVIGRVARIINRVIESNPECGLTVIGARTEVELA